MAADPGASAAWDHAQRPAPPRPNRTVTQTRFVIDREAYQGPSPTLDRAADPDDAALPGEHADLAWDFLALAEPEHWDEYFAAAEMPRAAGADFRVGGRRSGLFAHDFRAGSRRRLAGAGDRARAHPGRHALAVDRGAAAVDVVPGAEFDDSVRQALRDPHHPSLLVRNPLMRTRLVRDRAGDGTPDGRDA